MFWSGKASEMVIDRRRGVSTKKERKQKLRVCVENGVFCSSCV